MKSDNDLISASLEQGDFFFYFEGPEGEAGDGFMEELFRCFPVDAELLGVVVTEFIFVPNAVCFVVDDEEAVFAFQEAVHDALHEEFVGAWSLSGGFPEVGYGEENGEGHFFVNVFSFLHSVEEAGVSEGEELVQGFPVAGFSTLKEEVCLFL